MESLVIEDQQYPVDKAGYLLESDRWVDAVARFMADKDGLALSSEHWELIHFFRTYYLEYQVAPGMRMLVKAIERQFGPDKANSRHLYRLFPEGPAKQICRYAGLPKPVSCI